MWLIQFIILMTPIVYTPKTYHISGTPNINIKLGELVMVVDKNDEK